MKITLKAARVNVGLTQKEVAHFIKVSKHTIVNWEKGGTKVPYWAFKELCKIYECDIEDIILKNEGGCIK